MIIAVSSYASKPSIKAKTCDVNGWTFPPWLGGEESNRTSSKIARRQVTA